MKRCQGYRKQLKCKAKTNKPDTHTHTHTHTHTNIHTQTHTHTHTNHRVAQHADIQIRVAHPPHGLVQVRDRAQRDLCVQIVCKPLDELTFNGKLVHDFVEIHRELVVGGDERGLAQRVELRATGAAKDLRG